MPTSRAERRAERRVAREPQVAAYFAAELAPAGLDLLEIVDLAWNDVYPRDLTTSDVIVDDLLVLSGGTIDGLVRAARIALEDWRDTRVAAGQVRARASRATDDGH